MKTSQPPAHDIPLPPALRTAIERDLRPVQSLAPPSRRVVPLVPMGVALLLASVLAFGVRADASILGLILTWGASILQMALGLVVMTAALREAVPGSALTRRTIAVIGGTVLFVVLGITWATWWTSPTTIRPAVAGYVWRICVAGTVLSALPALFLSSWLVTRAFPLRPRLAGALYGLGAGLLADAGWRLFCHYSDPAHVLGAHSLAIVIAILLGISVAHLLDSRRFGPRRIGS